MQISGIILAGGQGKRMGGLDKGLVAFHGLPMVAHVIKRLRPQVSEIIINANRETARYAEFGHAVVSDRIAGYAGPLAGLHAGMQAASHPYVLSVPCDSPLLPARLVQRLLDALLLHDADIAVAQAGGQLHPVFSLSRRALLPSLEQYLQQGGRKVEAWQRSLHMVTVAFDDQAAAFSNVNTAQQLTELESAG